MKTIFTFLIFLSLTSCSFKSNRGIHELNISCNTQKELIIKSIDLQDKSTIIKLSLGNNLKGAVYLPGQKGAFFISDPKENKVYRLTNLNGISIAPKYKPAPNFTLVFEPLPKDLFQFNLIEGQDNNDNGWHFLNIKIPEK